MKYLFINSVYGKRSTGKIIADKCHELQSEGSECMVAYGREHIDDKTVQLVRIGSTADQFLHALLSRIFDNQGFCSAIATRRLIKIMEQFRPDVIWLHNLHGYYINVRILFKWLKKQKNITIYWTLHDCWAFTGHCAYFTMAQCSKWKEGCTRCTQLRTYPKTYLWGRVSHNYRMKKKAFTGVPNLTLITPSRWLANLTRESFLAQYPVEVIHNTIDRQVFHPTDSDFRTKYSLNNQRIVLGVAVGWENTKGLPDMLTLRTLLDDTYTIVLVGVTEKQIRDLPQGILGITRTENQIELAGIYSAADVFVNPTHQDNYPTVNLEALACGTPVVTYDVGGSPESAGGKYIVKENDIEGLAEQICALCEGKK